MNVAANAVLANYRLQAPVAAMEPVRGGGFSGARVWKVRLSDGTNHCLRQWPAEQPTVERLTWMHAVLRHATRHSTIIPSPQSALDGRSFVEHTGRLWQLEPWMPGLADDAPKPSDARLAAALQSLAEFHAATADFLPPGSRRGPSQAVGDRRALLRDCLTGGIDAVRRNASAAAWPELAAPAERYFRLFEQAAPHVYDLLAEVATAEIDLQPIVGDIHREHVLFEGERVSGLVDFGALRVDHVALDVARLVGSFVADDASRRDFAVTAYRRACRAAVPAREFIDRDIALVGVFDRSGTLLSPYRWLRWIHIDGRRFDDRAAVVRRFDHLLQRLARFVETSGS